MTEQTASKMPQIRFKGFEGEWEHLELRNVSEIKTGPFGSALHASDYVQDGVPIVTTEHFKNWHLPSSKTGLPQVSARDYERLQNYVLKCGDLVFSRVGSIDINAYVEKTHNGWLFSGRVLRVRGSSKFNGEYLHHELSTWRVRRSVATRSVGQTMPCINTEILGATTISVPNSPAEQTQIGEYFRELDSLIGLHQRKHDKLATLKKAMLQKMFPQPGATTPEIRFKGFSGDWMEGELGKLGAFSKGQGYSKSDLSASGTPIVLYGRLYVNYQTEISDVDTFVAEKNGAVKSIGKEVVVPASGETAEDIARASAILTEGIILGGDLNIIYPFKELDSCFLALTLSNGKPQSDLAKRAQGKTVVHVRQADLESISIYFPKLTEQQKIGTYFRTLDELISKHATQLQKLQQIKSACLARMFV